MRTSFVAVFLLGSLFGCGPEEYSWNQRMTLVVETPSGIVTGSSVVEIDVTVFPDGEFLTNRTASFGHHGEAVAVEIAPGQWLFALLHEYPGVLMHHAGGEALFGDTHWREYGAWMPDIPRTTEPMALPRETWSRLVTFEDIEDPVSVAVVDSDDLAATFGEGVRLIDVTLEVTREEALPEILSVLPWLGTLDGGALDGARVSHINAENRLANDLSLFDFRRP